MPLPRFWYLPRGEKAVVVMSGDDHSPTQAPGGTASHFDRYQGAEPGRLRRRRLGVRALDARTSTRTRRSRTRRPPRTSPTGFEVGAPPADRVVPDGADHRRRARRVLRHAARARSRRSTRASAPVSSRTHCVYWPDWASNAKVELARGIRMDANYYHYPGPWIGARPGFMNGGGFPMRFADLDGDADRRLPGEHAHDRRVDDDLRRLDRVAARQRRRRRRATTAPSARTCTPTTPRRTRAPRRSSRLRRPAACRWSRTSSCSTGSTAATPRRSAGSQLERRHARRSSRPSARARTGSRRCCRCKARPGR